ncbi:MAG: hypothetical protein SF028_07860 [Candidatus Sumerlaeia bacterium]|nr:hypothetical protein [Candidatus Sumerlaeia bacterium]
MSSRSGLRNRWNGSPARPRRGFTILSVLMAVMIVMILSKEYFEPQPETGKSFQETAVDRARSAVATLNLRQAEMAYMAATLEGGRIAPERLRVVLDGLPRSGDGGRYWVDEAGRLTTTTAVGYTSFAERLGVPQAR